MEEEYSVSPEYCPVDGHWVVGCAPFGCPHMAYTEKRRYIYCGHPNFDREARWAEIQQIIANAPRPEPRWLQPSFAYYLAMEEKKHA